MDNSEKLLPDFLLIGAAKSGTSSVAQYLAQHPNIYMCPVKEPHYFSYNDKSKHTTGPGDVIHKAITNYEDYKGLFLKAPIDSLKGEASTSYLYREEAPYRIREMIPNVKLIAILRNPIDRAYSAYMHQVRDGNETASTFHEGLALALKKLAAEPELRQALGQNAAKRVGQDYSLQNLGLQLKAILESAINTPALAQAKAVTGRERNQ